MGETFDPMRANFVTPEQLSRARGAKLPLAARFIPIRAHPSFGCPRPYHATMNMMDDLAGHLLLALPMIGDPRFHRSVIAMCSHDGEGALGIDIASPIAHMTADDVFEQFDIATSRRFDQPVLFGGPVEPQRGFIVHSTEWASPGALGVADRWALSASLDTLTAIARGEGPRNWLLALGYAGWGGGQLEGELAANAWHVGDYDEDIFYRVLPNDKWTATFAAQGIDADRIAYAGGSA